MVVASTCGMRSSRAIAVDSRPALIRLATVGSMPSGPPDLTSISVSRSMSRDSPSVVPMETRTWRSRSSDSVSPESSSAIRAAATENWPARPTSSSGMLRIQRSGSKSGTSQAFLYANPSVSKSVMGLTPDLPAFSAATYSSTPVPMLEITPNPVSTTRREAGPVSVRGGVGDMGLLNAVRCL